MLSKSLNINTKRNLVVNTKSENVEDDRTVTYRSLEDNIAQELREIICLNTEEGASLALLEQFCNDYDINDIFKTITRRKDKHKDVVEFFYKNLRNVRQWTLPALQLLISSAVAFGNPLFERLP